MGASSEMVFRRFVPEAAVPYCDKLYASLGFELQVKKTRRSKQGDYRFDPRTKKHTITINNDLNPYSFLITYIHEVAHLATFKRYGRSVDPHGEEWKDNFKRGMAPVLNEEIFPNQVLLALKRHLRSPKAASCSDPILYEVLKQYDPQRPNETTLRQITNGEVFSFQGEDYQKLEKRRTRALCRRLSNGKKYLISEVATVLKISE